MSLNEVTDEEQKAEQINAVEAELRMFGIRIYRHYSFMILAAASSGKNYFRQSEIPTEDCVRTARVIMNLFIKPSTSQKIEQMIYWSASKTLFETEETANTLSNLCQSLNVAAKQTHFNLADFEELKKEVVLPHPTKNFIREIQPGESVLGFGDESDSEESDIEESETVTADPEIHKYFTMNRFLKEMNGEIVNAILTLSQIADLESNVDLEFSRAFDDYQKDLLNKSLPDEDDNYNGFSEKVDEYFKKNSVLKKEYEKLIKK